MSQAFSTTAKHIRRSPYQALAASLTLSLTFFAVSVFGLLMAGSYMVLRYFEKAPQVIAFFERGKDISEADQQKIKERLEATGKLASFKYVSSQEAVAIYKEGTKQDTLLSELVDNKILPPSIEISATEISSLPQLRDILKSEPLVREIGFYEDIVNTLSKWVRNLRIV